MSTLVLGGYGNFGARVVRALADEPMLARVTATGRLAPGGFTAAGLLRLEDFVPLFARWGMQTRVIDQG